MVTPEERSELVSLYSGGGLTVGEVKEVFRTFLRSTWGDVIADDVVTAAERKKLLAIVRELRLPDEQIPRDVRDALDRAA